MAAAASRSQNAPIGQALCDVADELQRLGALAERLQDTLSPLLLASPQVLAEAQALDRMAQHARDLATFVERCGQACEPGWTIDAKAATAGLKLSEVADRLGGGGPSPELAPAGDLELW